MFCNMTARRYTVQVEIRKTASSKYAKMFWYYNKLSRLHRVSLLNLDTLSCLLVSPTMPWEKNMSLTWLYFDHFPKTILLACISTTTFFLQQMLWWNNIGWLRRETGTVGSTSSNLQSCIVSLTHKHKRSDFTCRLYHTDDTISAAWHHLSHWWHHFCCMTSFITLMTPFLLHDIIYHTDYIMTHRVIVLTILLEHRSSTNEWHGLWQWIHNLRQGAGWERLQNMPTLHCLSNHVAYFGALLAFKSSAQLLRLDNDHQQCVMLPHHQ